MNESISGSHVLDNRVLAGAVIDRQNFGPIYELNR